ncbi:MAG TPA: class I SAM-dependent methyltransferase [Candidatus Limnocylindrales bacterium]|nr:class I SAM-dependent methyltransferase [Candidatus Limnocylindrales bacterium]
MSFNVAADAYDAFMGRYSKLLVGQMADLARLRAGDRAIDVGSGPGALTTELVRRLGADHVTAVDPSEPFVTAARERHPGVEVQVAGAEALPFPDATFDAALAQLVVHFMIDPVAGIREMARVTRPGGTVVACVWDFAGGRSPLSPFWDAVAAQEPGNAGESRYAGARQGHLVEIFRAAGLADVEEHVLEADNTHATFEDWWVPFAGGVGPAGAHAKALAPEARLALAESIRATLPPAPFTIRARAWAATGRVGSIP